VGKWRFDPLYDLNSTCINTHAGDIHHPQQRGKRHNDRTLRLNIRKKKVRGKHNPEGSLLQQMDWSSYDFCPSTNPSKRISLSVGFELKFILELSGSH